VLNGAELSEAEMQEIAFKVGFNETAFPIKSDVADLRVRFFTPGHEMNLCGHATMATVYALKCKGILGDKTELIIETNAGILAIKINGSINGEILITME
jgi:PhzF family phenazine biosynthesis protein